MRSFRKPDGHATAAHALRIVQMKMAGATWKDICIAVELSEETCRRLWRVHVSGLVVPA